MSEIKVNSIKGVGASTAAISIDNSSGTCTANITNNLSNRNLIINGAMQVAARSTSVSGITSSGYYTVDRFNLNTTDEATYTMEQSSDAPAGFKNSTKFTITTADSSVAADDYAACHYLVEGHDFAQLGFGATGAKSFTLSFYVKSSQTGTFGLNFQNSANNRNFNSSYTISAANTWERKTITIPPDTSGTWLTTNGIGLKIWWSFLVGSTYEASSVSTAWGTTLGLGLNGQVQLSSITNATWQITGVQLEVGSVATDFEHRSFGQELALCQRYYYRTADDGAVTNVIVMSTETSTAAAGGQPFPTAMRAVPTITFGSGLRYYSTATTVTTFSMGQNRSSSTHMAFFVSLPGGGVGGQSATIYRQGVNGYIEANAEL